MTTMKLAALCLFSYIQGMSVFECKKCGFKCGSMSILSQHIGKMHQDISKQEYYDRFCRISDSEGVCPTCGKPTKFKNIVSGYFEHCSGKCRSNDPRVRDKYAATSMEHFGVVNVASLPERAAKTRAAKKARYGSETFNNREKAETTCIERYGVSNAMCNPEIERARDKSNMPLYGSKAYTALMQDRFGVDTPMKSETLRMRQEDSVEAKYGCRNVFQSDIIIKKAIATKIKNTITQITITVLARWKHRCNGTGCRSRSRIMTLE